MLYKIIKLISNEATNTTIFCYTTLALLSLDITKNTIWGPKDVSLIKNIALTLYLHLQTAIIVKCTIWKGLWLAFMYLLLDCFWDYFRNPYVPNTQYYCCYKLGSICRSRFSISLLYGASKYFAMYINISLMFSFSCFTFWLLANGKEKKEELRLHDKRLLILYHFFSLDFVCCCIKNQVINVAFKATTTSGNFPRTLSPYLFTWRWT